MNKPDNTTITASRAIAWATVPQTGGTYRFYQLLRKAIEPLGWAVWGVSVGKETLSWDESLADDHCVKVGNPTDSFTESAKAFVDWVTENNISIVMPVGSSIMSSAMPHMPANIKFLMQGNNITRHTYATTLVHRDRVSHYIGISKRHYDDLINKYRIPADKITLIPHALDLRDYSNASVIRRNRVPGDVLKLAYLGRLINSDKGIFLIPKIVHQLKQTNIDFQLQIAGDGPDRAALERKLKTQIDNGTVILLGNIQHKDVPMFLAQNDVFLMPSNFEGFGFTLIEAMAAGCVPVVSFISGVTNWIVTHEKTGFLCPIGNATAFVKAIEMINEDKQNHSKISKAAQQEVSYRFSITQFAKSYDEVFNKILAEQAHNEPRDWDKLVLSTPYRHSWHQLVPKRLKMYLRKLHEMHLAKSDYMIKQKH